MHQSPLPNPFSMDRAEVTILVSEHETIWRRGDVLISPFVSRLRVSSLASHLRLQEYPLSFPVQRFNAIRKKLRGIEKTELHT